METTNKPKNPSKPAAPKKAAPVKTAPKKKKAEQAIFVGHKGQRIGVFVDVQNLYYSAKNLYKTKVNFASILKSAIRGRELIRAKCYVINADIQGERNFHEALENIGYEVTDFSAAHRLDEVGLMSDATIAGELLDLFMVVVVRPAATSTTTKIAMLTLHHHAKVSPSEVVSGPQAFSPS